MTVLRLQLDDRTLTALQARADATRHDLEQVASQVLASAVALLPLAGRAVVLSGDPLEQLESQLGGGSILNAADLEQKVARLASISFAHVRLPFTPGHLEEIASRAERLGITPEQLIERTAQKMYELFFTHLGQGVGV
jgi:hypothetical protein